MSKKKDDNPIAVDIRERLAKVETRLDGFQTSFDSIDKKFEDVFDRIKTLDNRLWALLAGVIITILLALLQVVR